MSLKLNDRSELVRNWRIVMAKRFAGYAKIHGPLPGDTDLFGARAVGILAAHWKSGRVVAFRYRWRYLAWFDVKRARLWQGVICVGVVMGVILGLLIAASF